MAAGPAVADSADDVSLVLNGTPGLRNDAGWRMLSVPVSGAVRADLADDVEFDVAGEAQAFYTWTGERWQAGSSGTPLAAGHGFIVYLFDDEAHPIDTTLTIDVPGPVNTNDVEVAGLGVDHRWHVLGNPFDQSLALSSLDLVENGFQATVQIADPVTRSYVLRSEAESVAPWQGFVAERSQLAAGASELTLPADGRTEGATFVGKRSQNDSSVRVDFELVGHRGGGGTWFRDSALHLVFHDAATLGWDAYESTKLPPLDDRPTVFAAFGGEHKDGTLGLAQASLPSDLDRRVEVPLLLRPFNVDTAASDLVVRWEEIGSLPEAWEVALFDHVTGDSTDMRRHGEYQFAVEFDDVDTTRFTLVVDGASSTAAGPSDRRTTRTAIRGSAPNPFRGTTTIRYELAEPAAVRLVVYDMLGREVDVLLDDHQHAGPHAATWQPGGLPAGVYLIRLQAGRQLFVHRTVHL